MGKFNTEPLVVLETTQYCNVSRAWLLTCVVTCCDAMQHVLQLSCNPVQLVDVDTAAAAGAAASKRSTFRESVS